MKLRYLHPLTFKDLNGKPISFKQLNDIAKITPLQEFAANKSRFLQFPSYADPQLQKANSKEFTGDFEDYDFLAFLMPLCDPTLLIVDYDEPQAYEDAKNTYAEYCLAHKSQKGGHIWLNLGDKATKIKQIITQRREVGVKTARGKVDYFFGGEVGLIYTSFALANDYYTNETQTMHPDNLPQLTSDLMGLLISEYENLVGVNVGKENILLQVKPQQMSAALRKQYAHKYQPHLRDSVYQFIQDSLKNGKINLNDLKLLYDTDERTCENARHKGSRTLTLHSIKAWAASCGFIEKWSDLARFMELIRLEFCPDYDEVRFKKEVCNIKRVEKDYYLASEWAEFKQNFKCESAFLNLPNVCVAKNIRYSQPTNEFIICDQVENVFLYRNRKQAIAYIYEYKGLKEQIKFSDKGVADLNLAKIPNMLIEEVYGNTDLIVYDERFNRHRLNIEALGLNPKIAEILHKNYTQQYLADLKEWYDKSELETLFKENWIPERDIRLKFQGDLGYHLKTGKNLKHMMTLQDIGDTGKTQILKQIFLRYCFVGEDLTSRAKDDDDTARVFTQANSHAFGEETAHQIATSQFTAWKRYRALIIDEDSDRTNSQGKSIEPQFYDKMKGFIKTPQITIHRKGLDPYTRVNHSWAVRFTNNTAAISQEIGAQNRFYFSHGQKNIVLNDETSVQKYFEGINNTSELIAKIKNDLERYLEYYLLVAPQREGYCGFETIERYDTITADIDALDEIYEIHRNSPHKFFLNLMSYAINDNGDLSFKRAFDMMEYITPQDKGENLVGKDTEGIQHLGWALLKLALRDFNGIREIYKAASLAQIDNFEVTFGIFPQEFIERTTIKVSGFCEFFIKQFYKQGAEHPLDTIYSSAREAIRTCIYDKLCKGSTKNARIAIKGVIE